MKRLVLLFFFFASITLQGQSFDVGVYGGVSYYDGDLGPNRLILYFQTLRPAFGFFARANMAPWLSLRASYMHLNAMGDDAISNRPRGLSFRTRINEVALTAELNLFRLYLFGRKSNFYVEPYGYGGAGAYHFDPRTEYQGEWVRLQPLGTEGQGLPGYQDKYDLWHWSVIGGGGIKLHISDHFILGFDGSGRIMLTDYIDDVTNARLVYQDILEGNGPLAAYLSRPNFNPETGNTTQPYSRGGIAKDYVFTVGVTLSYVFGPDLQDQGRNSRVRCPEF